MSDLHLDVVGEGPGVVCTHGFADDSHTFDALVSHLADSHRVAVWDLPGHGASPVPAEPATRASALDGLERAIGAVAPGPVVLVGHSLGGYLSMCRAVMQPHDVAALVLISTGPGFRDPDKRAAWNETMASYALERGVPALTAGLGHQPDSLVLDNLASITAPALLIVGSHDRTYHRGNELLESSLPHARLVIVEGARHFPHQTHAPEVNAAIDAFLDDVSSARIG